MSLVSTPIVFVVDSDPSVRESLEQLVRAAGWQAETFAVRKNFSPARVLLSLPV